ncbi:CCND3 protein, partial [Oriolus oriolus]|nr:CCND3 protein [Oriolus oriolus]
MELLCVESVPRVPRAGRDPHLLGDRRVLQNLLSLEERYSPRVGKWRSERREKRHFLKSIRSLWELCLESWIRGEKGMLCWAGRGPELGTPGLSPSAALHPQPPLLRGFPLPSRAIVTSTPSRPVLRALQHWELLVLEKLKWDLVSVIANDFLAHILHRLPLPADKVELVKKHAQTFIALCATDYTFVMYPPSMIATGSIGAAIHGLSLSLNGFSGEAITELLAGITGTEVDCLKACQEQIEAALAESLKQASQSQQELSAKAAAYGGSQPTSTPTDVTDVNL